MNLSKLFFKYSGNIFWFAVGMAAVCVYAIVVHGGIRVDQCF